MPLSTFKQSSTSEEMLVITSICHIKSGRLVSHRCIDNYD